MMILFLLFVHPRNPAIPLYVILLLCLIPWILFEIINYKVQSPNKKINFIMVIMYFFSNFSAFVFFDSILLPVMMMISFFKLYSILAVRTGIVVNLSITIIYMIPIFLGKDNLQAGLIILVVHFIAFLLYKAIHESNVELRAEIKDQQIQIDRKNKLLSTLAHELRTPLMVIKTSTEILLEERPGKIQPTQKKFLSSSLDNTLRMMRFVDTLLASIKVEYTWFRMKKKSVDIRSSIKKVCMDMQSFISSREQELKYSYPNLLSKTIADENWIQQVLINLIHNASKHIGKNGRIIISATENEQCIVVSVSDDGSGIINQDKPGIFSEFYQGLDVRYGELEGVGLGLSIVKNVIEKHDGKVYVGSVAGLGTTLSFTLPKEDER